MLVTDDGIVTDVREVQYWKAAKSMEVTDVGMLTVLRAVQPWKALPGILVVPSGMPACPFSSGVTIQAASAPFQPSRSMNKRVIHQLIFSAAQNFTSPRSKMSPDRIRACAFHLSSKIDV